MGMEMSASTRMMLVLLDAPRTKSAHRLRFIKLHREHVVIGKPAPQRVPVILDIQ